MPRDDGLPTRIAIGLGPDGDPVVGLPIIYDKSVPPGMAYIVPFGTGITWDEVVDGTTVITGLDGVKAQCSVREPS